MTARPVRLDLDPDRLASRLRFGMLWTVGLVVGLDLGAFLLGWVPWADLAAWFDATSEGGLASWLAVTQTTLLAVTAWAAVAVARAGGASRPRAAGWTVLASFFSYLALDDGTRLHERVGAAVEASGLAGAGGWFPSYGWLLVVAPGLVALGLFMVAFLWRELRAPRERAAVVAAAGLMAVAVALDAVDGLGPAHPWNAYAWLAEALALDGPARVAIGMGGLDAVVHASRAVEEGLEMAAMTLIWTAVLRHLPALAPAVTVRWAAAPALPPASGDGASRPEGGPVEARPAAAGG